MTLGNEPTRVDVVAGTVGVDATGSGLATELKQDDIITAINAGSAATIAGFDQLAQSQIIVTNSDFVINDYVTLNGDGITTDMAVDGSLGGGGPKAFYYQVPANQNLRLTGITLMIEAAGAIDYNMFGNLPELTTGVTLRIGQIGNPASGLLETFKDNTDIVTFFPQSRNPFGTPVRTLIGSFSLQTSTIFQASQNLVVEFRIQDNLTGLDRMAARVTGLLIPT